jgi:hypothetical protein
LWGISKTNQVFHNLVSTKEELGQLKANFASGVPLGRMGQPDEIAKAALLRMTAALSPELNCSSMAVWRKSERTTQKQFLNLNQRE